MINKVWHFVKRTFLIIAISVVGTVLILLFLPDKAPQIPSDNRIVVVDKDGAKVIEDSHMSNLMREMDQRAEKARQETPTKEDRDEQFRKIWGEIKSHMVNPEPGTYPVRFYGPEDNVPLAVVHETTDYSYPLWVDNGHVAYWGGTENNQIPSPLDLVVLNVDTGKIVKVLATSNIAGWMCFDPLSGNFGFAVEDERYKDDKSPVKKTVARIGTFDKDFNFTEIYNRLKNPDLKITATSCNSHQYSRAGNGIRPEDGFVFNRKSEDGTGFKNGDFILTRRDGSQKEFTVNMASGAQFRYDKIRDQYFLSLHYSMNDQRTKVFYYDRDFNLLEEFTLPRVLLAQTYPKSFLKIPAKDGFIIGCGLGGDKPGAKDPIDGEPVRNYLCYVRRDQSIVRAVTGKVSGLTVSPDGCRVFGFWKEYSGDKRETGKNFMVDLCVNNNSSHQGE